MSSFRHYSKGFTLIELLIVIAVIGALAGALIILINPAAMLDRARTAKGKSFQGQLTRSLGFYSVGEWNFNTASTPGIDSSGNNNNGILNGGVSHVANCDLGFGGCMSFDGIDDFITLGILSSVNFSGSYTIGGWMNFRSYGDTRSNCGVKQGVIFSKQQDTYHGVSMGINDSSTYANRITLRHSKADESAYTTVFSPVVSLNTWYYVTGIYDKNGATMKMYINGMESSSLSTTGNTYLNPSGTAYVGGHDNNCSFQYPDAQLDEMVIYSQALSQTTIQQYYAKGIVKRSLASAKE